MYKRIVARAVTFFKGKNGVRCVMIVGAIGVLLIVLSELFPTQETVTVDPTFLDSKYAVVVDVEAREIVAGFDYDVPMYPASMTKVMTLLVACEHIDERHMNDHVILAADVVEQMQRV